MVTMYVVRAFKICLLSRFHGGNALLVTIAIRHRGHGIKVKCKWSLFKYNSYPQNTKTK